VVVLVAPVALLEMLAVLEAEQVVLELELVYL
jgi:hypothetical protein